MTSPRIPLNVQKLMAEKSLNKSTSALNQGSASPAGDVMEWVADSAFQTETRPAGIQSDYRVDIFRTSGNQVFRRYHDGRLDIEAAKNVVVEVVNKVKWGVTPPTDMEKLILSVYFPDVFDFMDPIVAAKMRAAQMNLSQQEIQLVATLVAKHFNEVMTQTLSTSGTSA